MGNIKQAIKLVLLTQRCQDHLLGNIQWSVTHRDERGYPPAVSQKNRKTFFFWHLNVLAVSDLKVKGSLIIQIILKVIRQLSFQVIS